MKKILLCILSIVFVITIHAQSQPVLEMSNAVTELVGSFMDNPYHHSNTLKIYNLTIQAREVIDEMYRQVPYNAQTDYQMILNMKNLLACLDFAVANILGYSRGGFDATTWENMFHHIIPGFGWTYKVIHSTEDIVFYEYSKENFKMILAKNILPKKETGDFNAVAFSCDSWDSKLKRYSSGIKRIVFGGNYQFVDYGDDENKCKKISRVVSKRGTSFDTFK